MYPSQAMLAGGDAPTRSNRLNLSTDGGGIRTNIGVQPLQPLPAESRGMEIANDLAQSLGLFRGLVGTIDQFQARQQAAQEVEDAKAEQFDRGEAVRAAAGTYAELAPAISERKIIAAVDDKDLGSYVEDLIASRSGGQPQAWRDEFGKQLRGRLFSAFGQQREGIRKEARESSLRRLTDRALGARQTVEIMDAVGAAKTELGLSDMDAHGAITIPALRLAAQQGDREKFEQATLVLPEGMFVGEVTRGETVLAEARQRADMQAMLEAEDEFAKWYESNPTNLPPYEIAIERLEKTNMRASDRGQWRRTIEQENNKAIGRERQTVEDMIGSALSAGEFDMARKVIEGGRGKFGDEWGLASENRVASYEAKVVDDISKEYETRWKASVNDDLLAVSMRAFADGTPGLAMRPDEETVTLPNNKPARYATKDAIDAIRPQVFAKFDELYPNDPQTALAEKARWLSANGVIAPEWKQAMDAGAAAATEDALSDPVRSQAAVQGFAFYRQLSSQDAPLAQQMVSERTRKLYDTADGLMAGSRTQGGGNPAAALLQASKILNDPMYSRHEARADSALDSSRNNQDSALLAAAKEIADGGVVTPDLQDTLRREARPLIIGGKDPAAALKIVTDRYKASSVVVGGENNRRPISLRYEGFSDAFRAAFPSYSETVLDAYHADQGKAEGYDRADLSMKFDPRTGRFAIVDTNGDLVRASKGVGTVLFDRFELERSARATLKQRIIDRNARRQQPRQINIPEVPEPPMGLLQ
jgi:hypothetical protein